MENNEDNKDPIIVFAEAVQNSKISDFQKDLLIREYIRNDKKIVESKITPIINDNKKAYFLGSIALISLCLILLVIVFEWAIKEKIFTIFAIKFIIFCPITWINCYDCYNYDLDKKQCIMIAVQPQ